MPNINNNLLRINTHSKLIQNQQNLTEGAHCHTPNRYERWDQNAPDNIKPSVVFRTHTAQKVLVLESLQLYTRLEAFGKVYIKKRNNWPSIRKNNSQILRN